MSFRFQKNFWYLNSIFFYKKTKLWIHQLIFNVIIEHSWKNPTYIQLPAPSFASGQKLLAGHIYQSKTEPVDGSNTTCTVPADIPGYGSRGRLILQEERCNVHYTSLCKIISWFQLNMSLYLCSSGYISSIFTVTSLFNEKFCIAENVQEPLILNYHFIATLQLRKPFIFNLDVGTGYLLLQVPLKNKQKTGKKNLNCMSQTAQAV